MSLEYEPTIERAAHAIKGADALLIGAGAGMGVDSGLPDFRGTEGFWKAYPPFRGRTYEEICGPEFMHSDPERAWGFYGHCTSLYRNTTPHAGFHILKNWGENLAGDHFVFTSNVDGHFQKTSFAHDRIMEVHGSFHHMQCGKGLNCSKEIWDSDGFEIAVDETTFRATSPLPKCIHCDSFARPNILMFGDRAWNPLRTAEQEDRFEAWFRQMKNANIVGIEIGAGNAVPTVRYELRKRCRKVIRINPIEYIAPPDAISVPLPALEALTRIDAHLI